jgi:hypothetical protein
LLSLNDGAKQGNGLLRIKLKIKIKNKRLIMRQIKLQKHKNKIKYYRLNSPVKKNKQTNFRRNLESI